MKESSFDLADNRESIAEPFAKPAEKPVSFLIKNTSVNIKAPVCMADRQTMHGCPTLEG